MPGGGPSPAETTLPLALKWPAPPARPSRPHRSPPPGRPARRAHRPAGAGCPGRPASRPPTPPSRATRSRDTVPTTPQGRRDRPGLLAPRATRWRARRPGAGARPAAPRGRPRPSAPAWCGPAPAWRSAPWSRGPPASCAPSSWSTRLGTLELGNAYNNANTLPNAVYYLMLGGIFTSVVVPLLVRAAQRDPDRGEAYAQRLFTLGTLSRCSQSPWWRRCWPLRWWT